MGNSSLTFLFQAFSTLFSEGREFSFARFGDMVQLYGNCQFTCTDW